jgi:hypothetical protein
MATGIVSIGLHLVGQEGLSQVLMVLDMAAWVGLAAVFLYRLTRALPQWLTEAATPPALTAVAGTSVLGTRLALFGWRQVAVALLIVAAVAWPVLLVSVVRHWKRGMPGSVFMVTVATQGLSVLSGTLADIWTLRWLAIIAFVLLMTGLALYVQALYRFDLWQLKTGAGDHWVAGGALAISALAGSKLVAFSGWTSTAHSVLRVLTFVLLGLALAWYAVTAVAEVLWPRRRYDIRRWATVFPMGMSAAACLSTSAAAKVRWLEGLGKVLLWVAFAAWLLTMFGLVRAWVKAAGAPAGAPASDSVSA